MTDRIGFQSAGAVRKDRLERILPSIDSELIDLAHNVGGLDDEAFKRMDERALRRLIEEYRSQARAILNRIGD